MLSLAPTIMYEGRSTAKNLLSYTQSAGESGYTFYDASNNLSSLRKGVPWPLPSITNGPIKIGGGTSGELFILATFSAEVWINEVQAALGQFNGHYNQPRRLSIYRGSNVATPLVNPSVQNLSNNSAGSTVPALTVFDLAGNSAAATPSNTYLFRFWSASNQNVAIQGLAIYGDVA